MHSCLNEEEMRRALRDSVAAYDADIITGYNIVGFDIPYRNNRIKLAESLRWASSPVLYPCNKS